MKRLLIIDRDGTIIAEPPDEQIDSLEKLLFLPHCITTLARICEEFDVSLIMATNQDGLGTASFPEETFYPAQNKMLEILRNEGVEFDDILIDRSFAHENKPTRKPGIGMFTRYLEGAEAKQIDWEHSFVIGDRLTDAKLAQNLGAKAIMLQSPQSKLHAANPTDTAGLPIALEAASWLDVYGFLLAQERPQRKASVHRKTNETDIAIELNLDGSGKAHIHTGLGFFDHMLDQVARHSGCDLTIHTKGDLHIDEHHTIEDTALALGEAFLKALGDKRGIERYGYCLLPMDEALAEAEVSFGDVEFSKRRIHAALDFSGRNWLVWDAEFHREKIGDVPTEMFHHFFKSFTDTAKCTLNIRAEATNEHHKIESVFKAFARAIKIAVRRDASNNAIPSTKGVL
ncbi:MAG: bifunctional histidinol-phosphatase/imidazoleglycerol-phosphate dehydratase HisB [Candidatus Kapabacteria bacterium]|jgi:imidazoleglycerol-phosphate dehydratase/histidinol-phosphatase|nr:bifunctional histidinol-phosphatase/imidazoleglycerol-phosphate dehydratase HisB [Candidatus Kapabacteria bacterium]